MLAGLPASPNESSEHKERVAAPCHQLCRVGVVSARFLRTPNARGILQRCKLFARGLQRGPEATRLRSRLHMRSACHAKPRNGARLRAALAIFFGKANAVHGNRLSGGATHHATHIHAPQHRSIWDRPRLVGKIRSRIPNECCNPESRGWKSVSNLVPVISK